MFGGSTILGIGLRVYMINQFTNQANAVAASMNMMNTNAEKLRSTFQNMAAAGAGLMFTGAQISRVWGDVIRTGLKFDYTMTAVGAVADASNAQLMMLSDTAKQLSREFPFTAQEIAEGMERIAKGGIKAEALPELTKTFLAASTAAREAFGGDTGVAEMLTDVMQAWNLAPEQARAMGDMMTTAALESTTSFRQIYESFTYSQDTFKNLNISMEESLALIALIGNQGVKASRAGIALQNMYKELTIAITGSDRANKKGKAFAMMGIDPAELQTAQGDVKGTLELFSRMKEGIRELSTIERERVLQDIFGVRGKRGATPLIMYLEGTGKGSVTKSLKELTTEITNASNGMGSMDRIIKQLEASPEYQRMLLVNAWQEFKITLTEAIPLLIEALTVLKKIVHALIDFAKTPIGKTIATIALLAGPILIVVGAFKALTAAVGLLFLPSKWMSFGSAAGWAWGMLAGRAAKFLGILRNIGLAGAAGGGLGNLFTRRFNSLGSLIAPNGRIILTAQTIARFGIFGNTLARVSPMLTRFLLPVAGLIRLASPIGLLSAGLSALGITLKTQVVTAISLVVMGFYTIYNVIIAIADFVGSFFGVAPQDGGFAARHTKMWDKLTGNISRIQNQERLQPGAGAISPMEQRSHDNQMRFINRSGENKPLSQTVVNIYQDGKLALTKAIDNAAEHNLSSQFGFG